MNRNALVTGGGGGIGGAVCRALAAAGLDVAAADVSAGPGVDVVLDVTDPASVAAGVASLGRVDVLVNCAGWDLFMPFVETDESFQAKVLEVNLAGPMRVTRAVLPGMLEAGWGRIVNIASDAGRVGSSLEAIYSGAKGGLIAFTKTIAREVARHGITANTVCPGPTDTAFFQTAAGDRDARALVDALVRAVPMRRLGTPEDIAPAVAFLASDAAAFITGQTLSVSGGLTML